MVSRLSGQQTSKTHVYIRLLEPGQGQQVRNQQASKVIDSPDTGLRNEYICKYVPKLNLVVTFLAVTLVNVGRLKTSRRWCHVHTHDAQAGEWCQQVIDQQAEMHDPTWFHGQGYAKVVTIYIVLAGYGSVGEPNHTSRNVREMRRPQVLSSRHCRQVMTDSFIKSCTHAGQAAGIIPAAEFITTEISMELSCRCCTHSAQKDEIEEAMYSCCM